LKLILENFRSFAGRHEIPIRPLTFLIGENSTGKTSLLAALQAVSDRNHFPFGTTFNEPPYSLGDYNSIAHSNGRGRATETFEIGYELDEQTHGIRRGMSAVFGSRDGRLLISSFSAAGDRRTATGSIVPGTNELHVVIGATDAEDSVTSAVPIEELQFLPFQYLPMAVMGKSPILSGNSFSVAVPLIHDVETTVSESIAPVRSRPLRTYDQGTVPFDHEGAHIPYALRDMEKSLGVAKYADFRSALLEYGKDSDLFDDIVAQRIGSDSDSSFRIMVTVGGRKRNLVDVGYGVSQVLPILVNALAIIRPRRFLIQQPEIHLHPQAQAALGSLLARTLSDGGHSYVIETHSDYILDRIRIGVAEGTVAAEEVLFLFLERTKSGSVVHPIEIDGAGNILNAPPGYRGFFIKEELRLLDRVA
jgi:hypothetical protein